MDCSNNCTCRLELVVIYIEVNNIVSKGDGRTSNAGYCRSKCIIAVVTIG